MPSLQSNSLFPRSLRSVSSASSASLSFRRSFFRPSPSIRFFSPFIRFFSTFLVSIKMSFSQLFVVCPSRFRVSPFSITGLLLFTPTPHSVDSCCFSHYRYSLPDSLAGRSPFPAFSQAHSRTRRFLLPSQRFPPTAFPFIACLPPPIPAGRSLPQRPPSHKVRCAIHCASPSLRKHYASLRRLQGRALRVLAPSASLPPKNR